MSESLMMEMLDNGPLTALIDKHLPNLRDALGDDDKLVLPCCPKTTRSSLVWAADEEISPYLRKANATLDVFDDLVVLHIGDCEASIIFEEREESEHVIGLRHDCRFIVDKFKEAVWLLNDVLDQLDNEDICVAEQMIKIFLIECGDERALKVARRWQEPFDMMRVA